MKIPNKGELQKLVLNHSSDINSKDFIKVYKNCTDVEFYCTIRFFETTLASDNPLRFRKILRKMQYNINRKAAEISALSSGKIDNYEYFTGKNIAI